MQGFIFLLTSVWLRIDWKMCFLLQDYSKFLDDLFDPKDWINAAFRANKDSGATSDVRDYVFNLLIISIILLSTSAFP